MLMSAYRIRIAGYRVKDGKLVPDVRRLFARRDGARQEASEGERLDADVGAWSPAAAANA
jgi:hypothetical protein